MSIKLETEISNIDSRVKISLKDKITMLGSCFSDNIGAKLQDSGFNLQINPFGTLYNPESILDAVRRLESGIPFVSEDCVKMGAGLDMLCSFSHHSRFARKTAAEFLDNANSVLESACEFWKSCTKVIITLGSAWVWRHEGRTVANCLKRDSSEFTRELLTLDEIQSLVSELLALCPRKEFIFTVSPIRHLGEFGAHANTISKSLLHLGLSQALNEAPNADYFPAYEIMMDELRDYRFYAEDLVHPSPLAINIIWEHFLASCIQSSDYQTIKENIMASRKARHKEMFK